MDSLSLLHCNVYYGSVLDALSTMKWHSSLNEVNDRLYGRATKPSYITDRWSYVNPRRRVQIPPTEYSICAERIADSHRLPAGLLSHFAGSKHRAKLLLYQTRFTVPDDFGTWFAQIKRNHSIFFIPLISSSSRASEYFANLYSILWLALLSVNTIFQIIIGLL